MSEDDRPTVPASESPSEREFLAGLDGRPWGVLRRTDAQPLAELAAAEAEMMTTTT